MNIKWPRSPSDTFDVRFPENMPFDVVGFGLNSLDHLFVVSQYPRESGKSEILQFEKLPGGQVATSITFLARMGLKTKYIGKVGDDELGPLSLKSFDGDSVDVSSVLVEKGARSQMSVIAIDSRNGERTVFWHRDPRLNFTDRELDEASVCSGRMLYLDGYDPLSLNAAWRCRKRGIPVCMDLDAVVQNCGKLLEQVDFLIVSSNFSSEYTGIADPDKSFKALRRCFRGFLVVTLGADGAKAWLGDECVVFPGFKVDAVDTTGAGDIFHGAFIYGLFMNWPIGKIMKFANAAAAISCKYLGARSGIRPLAEILQYVG